MATSSPCSIAVRPKRADEMQSLTTFEQGDEAVRAFRQHQRSRRDVLARHLPFSWGRLLFGLISLALVFSDIPRSRLGIRGLSSSYPRVQPDEFVVAGPSNISTLSGDRIKARNSSIRVWVYKYDTMSIVWRVFGEHLKVEAFPDCFFYRSKCPNEDVFNGEVAFNMLDALGSALAAKRDTDATRSSREPTAITVRSENEWIDRFHHFLLPQLFLSHVWRTNQALYYPPALLLKHLAKGKLCYVRGTRPNFCEELWSNLRRSCAASNVKCRAVGAVQASIVQCVKGFRAKYPNLTFDLSILESQDDWQMARGGVVPVGLRRGDVSTLIRGRDCSSGACTTVIVDEYRYVSTRTMSDADQWYSVVAVLRAIGQGYFYVRFAMLVVGCYYVQAIDHPVLPLRQRLLKTAKLVAKVLVQCIVYGSPLPVVCYAAAHLIDATITYTVLHNWFISVLGLQDFSVREFVPLTVMQMRNVWLYALCLHGVVKISTARRWLAWRPMHGVIGVPEFLMSAVSALTIASQYRSTSFRSTRMIALHEIPAANCNRRLGTVRWQHGFIHRGSGNIQLGGVIIDLKFLFCALVALVGLILLVNAVIRIVAKCRGVDKPSLVRLCAPTPVPYSVGVLWPSVAMCIHWPAEYFCIGHEPRPSKVDPFTVRTSSSREWLKPRVESLQAMRDAIVKNPPSPFMSSNRFAFIQQQMEQLHERSEQVGANVAFMNLVVSSDPLIAFYLYVAGGAKSLGYYRSRLHSDKIFLLPRSTVSDDNEHTYDLELLCRVQSSQLSWTRLIQCG